MRAAGGAGMVPREQVKTSHHSVGQHKNVLVGPGRQRIRPRRQLAIQRGGKRS